MENLNMDTKDKIKGLEEQIVARIAEESAEAG